MKIQNTTLDALNMNFDRFSQSALSAKHTNLKKFIISLEAHEGQYKKAGYLEIFAEKLYNLIKELLAIGKVNFAGIVSSNIVKISELPFDKKEQYIKQAISVAETQNDFIHLAARYEDLYHLYSSVQDKVKMQKTLAKEECVLKEIVDNFDTSMSNYKTISVKHKDIEDFEMFLAALKVNYAKLLFKSRPQKAAQKLQQAMDIFHRLCKKNEYDFAQKMLFELMYCKRQSK